MKILTALALSLPALACSSTSTSDDVDWVDFGADPMQNPAYMAAMAASGTPGAPHAALAARVGRWPVEGKTWIAPGVFEFRCTANDILTPDGRPTRMTTSMNDDGSYTMRMYDTREGIEEFQSMELHYTRV